ncbi:hypothetical protein C8J56DRAFT_915890 [Mycena floridula]|nr:hypothetical protein C8J56DRAFT_915890 [Mycena floridula]
MLFLALLLPTVLASSPLVAWSSKRSLNHLPQFGHHGLLDSLFSANEYEAVVIVNQPGLHASDLGSLSPSSFLVKALASCTDSRQYPNAETHNITSYATVNLPLGTAYTTGKSVLISMPVVSNSDDLEEYDALLESSLSTLPLDHLVVYAGSEPVVVKRDLGLAALAPRKQGGILHRYQLLTPGIILTLLVFLFLLLPIVIFGIRTLASIQSPLIRGEVPKGYSAADKKNQ